ncbi:hypothetical protein PG994_002302, partial [Apiospora phragmitis]
PPSNNTRSLIRRPKMKTGAQRIASLICHTLKSYPLMMMRDNALPPFIHPIMANPGPEAPDMESLKNCISLMQLLKPELQGNRRLFWRNVRQECERLYKMSAELNPHEVIAALQAISIYIIVRLDDGETESNDIAGLLITTVFVSVSALKTLSMELGRTDFGQESVLSNKTPDVTWRHWIFVESGRRLCVLYQIVNMVVIFEPAAMCDLESIGIILSPLPARKQLWEADTAGQWMARIEKDLGAQTDYGMAVNGDFVKVSETPQSGTVAYGVTRNRQTAE